MIFFLLFTQNKNCEQEQWNFGFSQYSAKKFTMSFIASDLLNPSKPTNKNNPKPPLQSGQTEVFSPRRRYALIRALFTGLCVKYACFQARITSENVLNYGKNKELSTCQ